MLLHGYREWGTALPGKLLGMFALLIADRRKHELFAARDRFGEKPLVYYEDRLGVAFASELKVLAALPQMRRELNDDALPAYLCLNYVPGEETMLRGVKRLRPGDMAAVDVSGPLERRRLLDSTGSAGGRPSSAGG